MGDHGVDLNQLAAEVQQEQLTGRTVQAKGSTSGPLTSEWRVLKENYFQTKTVPCL